MLVLLAAATVVLAPGPTEVAPLLRPSALRDLSQPAAPRLCKGAGRLQTSGPDPALLHRRDLEDARIKKLIEMPMGEFCLLGGVEASRSASR